ncbi:hypothetical protein GCM10022234_13480 [Aeromicrobium panaciterrae]|uniref:Ig-like domain-containing protein n=1 Tax=Aeromicrobium panaciterrae TaxID=363861 RepID=UPI0031E2846A
MITKSDLIAVLLVIAVVLGLTSLPALSDEPVDAQSPAQLVPQESTASQDPAPQATEDQGSTPVGPAESPTDEGTPSTQPEEPLAVHPRSELRRAAVSVLDLDAPTVTGVSPSSGTAGTSVTINGTLLLGCSGPLPVFHFGDVDVAFGDPGYPAGMSDTQAIVTAPPHALGTVDITVTNQCNLTSPVSPTAKFTYAGPAVTQVSPSSGTAGTSVTINGTLLLGCSGPLPVFHFGDVDVAFGDPGYPAGMSDTQAIVTAPPHALGTVDITVTNQCNLTSPVSPTAKFTYAAPTVATDDLYSTPDGQLLTISAPGVLGNDTAGATTAALVDDATDGTLVLAADGSFTYEPDAGFTGTDTFTYTAGGPGGTSTPATVTITVVPVPPNAVGDNYSTPTGQPLHVAAPGVLANDTHATSSTLVSDVSHGTLTLGSDGSFTYTSAAGFVGTDSFTYTIAVPDPRRHALVAAADLPSETAVVSLSVTDGTSPVNDPGDRGDVGDMSDQALPDTGSSRAAGLLMLALLLIMCGALVIGRSRRRDA